LAAITETYATTSGSIMQRGVVIKTVINGLTFDGATKDPMQQAVRRRFDWLHGGDGNRPKAEATKEAQRAGIDYAKGEGRPVQGTKAELPEGAIRDRP